MPEIDLSKPNTIPITDPRTGKSLGTLDIPAGATIEQVQAAADAVLRQAGISTPDLPEALAAPTRTVGGALISAAKESAIPAAAATLAPMAIPGAGPGFALARIGAAGAAEVAATQAQTFARERRRLSAGEAIKAFASGAFGQLIPETMFKLSFTAKESDDVLKALNETIEAQGFRREAGIATSRGAMVEAGKPATKGLRAQREAEALRRGAETTDEVLARLGRERLMKLAPGTFERPAAAGVAAKIDVQRALGAVRAERNRLFDRVVQAATEKRLQVPAQNNPAVRAALEARDKLDTFGLDEAQKTTVRRVLEGLGRRGDMRRVVVEGGGLNARGEPATKLVMPDDITYAELDAFARDLREVIPVYNLRGQAKQFSRGALERVYRLTDQEMDSMLKSARLTHLKQKADAFHIYRYVPTRDAARALIRDTLAASDVAEYLAKQSPETLSVLLGRGDVNGVLAPHVADRIRFAAFSSVVNKTRDSVTGVFDAEAFLKWWRGLHPKARLALGGPNHADIDTFVRKISEALNTKAAFIAKAKRLDVEAKALFEHEGRLLKLGRSASREAQEAQRMIEAAKARIDQIQGASAAGAVSAARVFTFFKGLTLMISGHANLGIALIIAGEAGAPSVGRILAKPGLARLALKMMRAKPGTRAFGRYALQFTTAFLSNAGEQLSTVGEPLPVAGGVEEGIPQHLKQFPSSPQPPAE